MVYFSCNACGQSVKKNQVEKHYQLQCRNCEVLSCVDCGKEFRGDDYIGHTKCISEEEKYGGKDFKQTQSVNKGEVKQDKWIENIKSTIAAAKVPRPVFNLLEKLLTFSNIPRKKAKFEKFVQNSLKVYNTKLISEIWEVVNVVNNDKSGQKDVRTQEDLPRKNGKEKKQPQPTTSEESTQKMCENCEGEGCANCEENPILNKSEHEQIDSLKKKKKKHKRKREMSDNENPETNEPLEGNDKGGEGINSGGKHENDKSEDEQISSEAKKKKKHKRKKEITLYTESTVGELDINESNAGIKEQQQCNESGQEGISSIAKKRKKHKREKGKVSNEENGIHVNENMQEKDKGCDIVEEHIELECEQINSVTKKKKKHKRKNGSDEENCTQVFLSNDPEMKKRKKNKVEDIQIEFQCNEVNSSSKKKKSRH